MSAPAVRPLRLEGLVAATFTPMYDSGDLHLERIAEVVDHLVASGIAALYVSGTTGEGESLTLEERRASARAHVEAAAGRVPVIVQVGRNSLREARAAARDARRIGADAIAAAAPSFFKPASAETLVQCLMEIAVGAPALPLYYYHLPRMTGVRLDMAEVLRRGAAELPSLVGIKYSAPDLDGLRACLEVEGGRFEVLFGCDEILLDGLQAGARAAVGSTYNFAAPLYREVFAAFGRGDLAAARAAQARAARMVEVLLRHGGLPAFKAAMSFAGPDCGPVRLPLVALTPAQRDALRAELAAVLPLGRAP